jgi:hydroxymethylbilane synthase
VKAELERLHSGIKIYLNIIKTTGDKILDVPLALVGGKGLFVKEIEEALIKGEADIAVHSIKDVPVIFPIGLILPVICERHIPNDALIIKGGDKIINGAFKNLPIGARVGTSSLRRSSQLLNIRPDLNIIQLRGNVDTRLRKLDQGDYDAIILAGAGLSRLGLAHRITEQLSFDISLPAIGQGAIGIECREGDNKVMELVAPLNHYESGICVNTERAFLKKLEGGCQIPIAGYATIVDGNKITIDGLVGSVDGKTIIREQITGDISDYEKIGIDLAERLLDKGAGEILAAIVKM